MSNAVFIDVKKVIEVYEKQDNGEFVQHPGKSGKKVVKGYKLENETIRLDKIRSSRAWTKSSFQDRCVEGDFTVVYMEGDNSRETTAQILIQENSNEFAHRLNSIPLKHEIGA